MKKEHKKEFEIFGKMKEGVAVTARLVYIMGFLADTMIMKDEKEIKEHITDAREMIGIITKEVAQLEGIPIK